MRYRDICEGTFLERPNRFIARVIVAGKEQTVHVKNTGRCRELLLPGARVILERSSNPERKTAYDLIAVYKGDRLVNIDSQAPNQVIREWLETQGYDRIIPEYRFGSSRMDFYMEREGRRFLLEGKGCTLEQDGIGYFPDAPTERGVRHLHELMEAQEQGYETMLVFVIQLEGVSQVLPNIKTHPEFGQALMDAERHGVKIVYLQTRVRPDELAFVTERGIENENGRPSCEHQ